MNESKALYTKIQLPMQEQDEDEQALRDKIAKAENLLSQNFTSIQQQMADMNDIINALEDWAAQFRG